MMRYSKYTSVKESDIENYLVKKIAALGGKAIKFNPHNNRGLPDRICFVPGGVLILVELKRPGAKPRKNQLRQLEWFRKLGFQATWVDTKVKVDELIKWIIQYRNKHKMVVVRDHLCKRQDCPMRRY
ncbi:MAG: VRR-NUC domain-containing protein [Spirochaetaceae bacterium]